MWVSKPKFHFNDFYQNFLARKVVDKPVCVALMEFRLYRVSRLLWIWRPAKVDVYTLRLLMLPVMMTSWWRHCVSDVAFVPVRPPRLALGRCQRTIPSTTRNNYKRSRFHRNFDLDVRSLNWPHPDRLHPAGRQRPPHTVPAGPTDTDTLVYGHLITRQLITWQLNT